MRTLRSHISGDISIWVWSWRKHTATRFLASRRDRSRLETWTTFNGSWTRRS